MSSGRQGKACSFCRPSVILWEVSWWCAASIILLWLEKKVYGKSERRKPAKFKGGQRGHSSSRKVPWGTRRGCTPTVESVGRRRQRLVCGVRKLQDCVQGKKCSKSKIPRSCATKAGKTASSPWCRYHDVHERLRASRPVQGGPSPRHFFRDHLG